MAEEGHQSRKIVGTPDRLVLCFDGTGNKFLGSEADTNVVKIYQLLNRNAGNQFHYYQPGIGTYVVHQDSNSSTGNFWTQLKSKVLTAVDEAVGTSFVHHVLAGYRFVMRYYKEGDEIYVFGFSRGAYTARFLCEMLYSIGLLSRGNEEMVRHAWDTFSDYQRSRGNVPATKRDIDRLKYMEKFKTTFCRPQLEVRFLGLFDCVNSVSNFEVPFGAKNYNVIAEPPATHIRHAVSIHERRLKFKPALFHIDKNIKSDVKEMWFAGNHGDVGGGWGFSKTQRYLLSDAPLEWMINEVKSLSDCNLEWTERTIIKQHNTKELKKQGIWGLLFGKKRSAQEIRVETMQPHDMLAFGRGASWFKTLFWWILEILPIFSRLELENDVWVPRQWPPNLGALRDIPTEANIHPTVEAMYKAGVLSQEEMPVLGGTDPPIPTLPGAAAIFAARRKEIMKRMTLIGGGKGEREKELLVKPKSWDNMGLVNSRTWNGD
ncbi:hypothetical protein BU23DRAFT_652823 [Bimuria novae-zelandiae CBS 107.79]|uniref:T6SS Phospholipase effector Tle1-like catalytic domain-containing protein n=1 Tax=Bimuria novae-zelandiae CBS 107.79 TaxID=1447943 RepID=A0A6A5UXN8_9PLEO|nr:hypothetical protein BU23DRAFT_652823 [Bimuria novae-zelandiae CBS 107.79]